MESYGFQQYRTKSFSDSECLEAFKYAEETKCILSYERSFFRPVFRSTGDDSAVPSRGSGSG